MCVFETDHVPKLSGCNSNTYYSALLFLVAGQKQLNIWRSLLEMSRILIPSLALNTTVVTGIYTRDVVKPKSKLN